MRSRAAAALTAAALLALGATACGDGEDSATTAAPSTDAAQQRQQGEAKAPGGQSGAGKAGGDQGGGERAVAAPGDTSAEFTPRSHDDSGGGSEQFRIPGGDNSVQEFGGESAETDFEQVSAVLHNFFDARAQRAWTAACRSLAQGVVETLEEASARGEGAQGGSCAAGLAAMTTPAALAELKEEARVADVGSVRSEGERGFVIYEGQDGTTYTFGLIREGGGWKLTALAGFPLD